MKNPLIKRLPRELIGEFPKYIVIFLFMTLTIGFISGFLVAGNSMIIAYDESFEKYNIEDGHVEFEEEADDTMMDEVEKEENVTFYKDFYKKSFRTLLRIPSVTPVLCRIRRSKEDRVLTCRSRS